METAYHTIHHTIRRIELTPMHWTDMIYRLCAIRDTLKLMDTYVEYRPNPIFHCIDLARPYMHEREKHAVEAVIDGYERDIADARAGTGRGL